MAEGPAGGREIHIPDGGINLSREGPILTERRMKRTVMGSNADK